MSLRRVRISGSLEASAPGCQSLSAIREHEQVPILVALVRRTV